MEHAVQVLREELAVLRDNRRALVTSDAGPMTPAERADFLELSTREIAEVRAALDLIATLRRPRRTAA